MVLEGPSAQQHALIVEHLCCAKTRSHLTLKTAEAKEGASLVSLGPMWASPPKVGADVIISSSPPRDLRPICRNEHRARVTPRPTHVGSLGEAARACRTCGLLPGIRVGLGWVEEKEWSKERGLSGNEPGPTPFSPAPLREAQPRSASFGANSRVDWSLPV